MSKHREDELRRQIAAVEGEKNRLEAELEVMQQSMEAMASMAAGDGGAGSGDGGYQALKATSDAKVRALTNEVQFMRAQLGSESKCKEELAQSIARVNEQYAAAKTEWRAAILEARAAATHVLRNGTL